LWEVYYYFAVYFHKMVVMNANFRQSTCLLPVFFTAFSFKEKKTTTLKKPNIFYPDFVRKELT